MGGKCRNLSTGAVAGSPCTGGWRSRPGRWSTVMCRETVAAGNKTVEDGRGELAGGLGGRGVGGGVGLRPSSCPSWGRLLDCTRKLAVYAACDYQDAGHVREQGGCSAGGGCVCAPPHAGRGSALGRRRVGRALAHT